MEKQVKSLKIPHPSTKQISPKQVPVLPAIPIGKQLPPIAPNPIPAVGNSVKRVQNKDLTTILERQRLFKEAALKAKQDGNNKVALIYLRHAKVKICNASSKILRFLIELNCIFKGV